MTHGAEGEFTFERAEAGIGDLPALQDVVAEACATAGAPDTACADLRLAVEEAFTNVVEHAYGAASRGWIAVRLRVTARAIEVVITDAGRRFRPEDVPTPGLADDWASRNIGGLGWHLITRVMDEVHHTPRTPSGNVLRLVKHLPSAAG